MVVQVCIYTASCWTVNFKWVNFMVCKLIVKNAINECCLVSQSDRDGSLEILSEILKGIVKSFIIYACMLGRFQLFVTVWTVACQAPLSMGFSRQEYWSGLPFPPRGDLPTRDQTWASYISCIAGRFFTTRATWEALIIYGYAHIWSNYLEYCKGRINIQESCFLGGREGMEQRRNP